MATFAVTTETEAGPAIVRVDGELDIAAVPEVRRAIAEAEAIAPDLLVLDLAQVAHLDSSGLRVLLDAANCARERGRRLVIVAPPEGPVGRLLELTLLADHLDVVRDLGAALQ